MKEDTKQIDGKEEVDYLFHDVETQHAGQGWVGRGEHLCELDMYWAYAPVAEFIMSMADLCRYYEFRLRQVSGGHQTMDVFGVRYKVKGPQKDYT